MPFREANKLAIKGQVKRINELFEVSSRVIAEEYLDIYLKDRTSEEVIEVWDLYKKLHNDVHKVIFDFVLAKNKLDNKLDKE